MSSARGLELRLPDPELLTLQQRAGLLHSAVTQSPGAEAPRLELAQLCNMLLRDDDAVRLLSQQPWSADRRHEFALARGRSLADRAGSDDLDAARLDLHTALDVAPDAHWQSLAASELGKVQTALGDSESAEVNLRAALQSDPDNAYAFSRLATVQLQAGRSRSLLAETARSMAAGVTNSGLLASRFLALTQAGEVEEAEHLHGIHELLTVADLPVPTGWSSIAAFNAALAAEILGHGGARLSRASRETGARWRVDNPWLIRSVVFPQLLTALREVIAGFAMTLGDQHPWAAARPSVARINAWCVITHDGGFDPWHMHHQGWLSGVYYVGVPSSAADGQLEGSLQLGTPELASLGSVPSSPGLRLQPRPGNLILFPSHVFHRTHPTNTPERRISVAFDVIPREGVDL